MTKRNYEELIADLTKEERKAVEEKLKMLHLVAHECEIYLRGATRQARRPYSNFSAR